MSVAAATVQNYENFSNKRSCELLFFCKSTIFFVLRRVCNLFSCHVYKIERCDGQLTILYTRHLTTT